MKTAEEILNEFSTDTTTKGRVRFEDAVKAIESVSEEKDRRIRELEKALLEIDYKIYHNTFLTDQDIQEIINKALNPPKP